MKLKLIIILLIFGAIVFAGSQKSQNAFSQAEDFPRGALVYVQFADLPAFIKLWNESKLKQNYLASENFERFENRHLTLKLASRWQEFNDASGFPIDLETVGGISETRAAIAVYDIGRLDLVFIAPVSDEIFSASQFFAGQSNFEETELEDGTVFYGKDVEADKGRQKQKLVFANVRGRFVLATSEKLLLQTLANINGKSPKNSLADEPAFKNLSEKVTPHAATVWLNQANLNDDYYFKHYWLMGNIEDLKKFRAGMFDFEMQEGKWTERREFLLTENQTKKGGKINAENANSLSALLPENIPFYKLQTVVNQPDLLTDSIQNTLFERFEQEQETGGKSGSWQSYSYENFYTKENNDWHDYSYLSDKYDETIDDAEDAGINDETNNLPKIDADEKFKNDLQKVLVPTNPQIVLGAQSPQMLPAPLFAGFRKVTILTLQRERDLNREKLENALAEKLKSQLTIADSAAKLNWETKTKNNQTWRELNLPMLGWGIFYTLQDNKLIFSNSSELLQNILFSENKPTETPAESSFDDLTVIRLSEREQGFDQIINKLAGENSKDISDDFFAGNIGSLLDVSSDVSRIEITRNSSAGYLHEEINFIFIGLSHF
ncbi:MAG: hypothetical protein ACR2MG_03615 [Pyrinomonadaceae bacterium]